MKNLLHTAGLLLLLVIGAHCYGYNDDNFDGYNRISTYSTPEEGACMITLAVNTTPTAMYFNQTQQLLNNCVNSNITFNSFFPEDCVGDDTLVFYPTDKTPTVIDPITAALTTEDLQRQNGTGCVYLPQVFRPGYDKYFCAIRFSMVDIYLEAYGTGNFTFGPVFNYDYDLIPNYANRHLLDNAYNHVDRNLTFPNISAWLSESCSAAQGAAIQNISSTVYINAADLTVLRPNWTLAYSLVKRRGDREVGDYLVRISPSNDSLFDSSDGPCWALPITFQDMLTDSAYCAGDGCQVTLIVDDYQPSIYGSGRVYVIHTTGIVTVDTTTIGTGNGNGDGDGSTGTGTGTGSGTGGSTVVTVNDTNGNPIVLSALTTAFNVCLLVVSLVYISL